MSKVVRSVGRGIGNVVKGAVNLAQKVAKSKLGKIAIGSALVYFGVPAISGALGGAAGAGASGWAGAMNGINGAWAGLTGAASSALAGNFAEAGSSLSAGFTGGAGVPPPTATTLTSTAPVTTDYGFTGSTIKGTGQGISASLAPTSVQPAVLPPQTKGLLATIASSPHTAPALIQTAGGMLTRYGQGKTSQAMLERADQLAADERKRYNANVGASLWGQPQNRG